MKASTHRTSANRWRNLAIPVAIAGLVLGVAVTTWLAVKEQRQSSRAVTGVLKDYGGIAAWQYAREASTLLHQQVMNGMRPVERWVDARVSVAEGGRLSHPRVLLESRSARTCALLDPASLAFRIDVPQNKITWAGADGPIPANDQSRLSDQAIAAADLAGREPHRIFFDTLAGTPVFVAIGVVRQPSDEARAIYGIVSPRSAMAPLLEQVPGMRALLPGSLIARRLAPDELRIRVTTPAGDNLFVTPTAVDPQFAGVDTVDSLFGGLSVHIQLGRSLAGELIVGGIPESRVATWLVLLGACVLLGILAIAEFTRLRRVSAMRELFVANVSHELRTPLAQVSMFAETLMLGRERSAEERRQFAAITYREAKRLTNLVERVLTFTKLRSASEESDRTSTNIAEHILPIVETHRLLAESHGTTIAVDLADDLIVAAPPIVVQQIVSNLIDNAVKYGPPNQKVRLSGAHAHAEGCVELRVSDEGPGINPADRQRIFEPFVRLSNTLAQPATGTGIGLSIVHDLVLSTGGTIRVGQATGGGCEFVVRLPSVGGS